MTGKKRKTESNFGSNWLYTIHLSTLHTRILPYFDIQKSIWQAKINLRHRTNLYMANLQDLQSSVIIHLSIRLDNVSYTFK